MDAASSSSAVVAAGDGVVIDDTASADTNCRRSGSDESNLWDQHQESKPSEDLIED